MTHFFIRFILLSSSFYVELMQTRHTNGYIIFSCTDILVATIFPFKCLKLQTGVFVSQQHFQ